MTGGHSPRASSQSESRGEEQVPSSPSVRSSLHSDLTRGDWLMPNLQPSSFLESRRLKRSLELSADRYSRRQPGNSTPDRVGVKQGYEEVTSYGFRVARSRSVAHRQLLLVICWKLLPQAKKGTMSRNGRFPSRMYADTTRNRFREAVSAEAACTYG